MCGIAGIINWNSQNSYSELLDEMLDLISHRGPNDRNIFSFPRGSLGHARLAIIGLNAGKQPMNSKSKRSVVTFNGEIFNYKELAKDPLISSNLTSESDTEVLLELFDAQGKESFLKLNGQFAAAFYDSKNEGICLLRDRVGEKPLYFYNQYPYLIFASELKAIIHAMKKLSLDINLNNQAIFDFHSLNYVPGEATFIKGVFKLKPAHSMTIKDKEISYNCYWHPETNREIALSEQDWHKKFSELFTDSLQLRLRSDVPLGLFLSGGIDSTAVAVAMSQSENTKTLCCIAEFKESAFSEAEYAEEVCKNLGLEFKKVAVEMNQGTIEDQLKKLVWHGDEPLADSSMLPCYLLSKAAKEFVTVALSGDGADELFGGYLTYHASSIAMQTPKPFKKLLSQLHFLARILPKASGKVGLREKLDRFLRNIDLPVSAAHFAWNGMFSDSEKQSLFTQDFLARSLENTYFKLQKEHALARSISSLQSLLEADQNEYMVNDILNKVDRSSMASALEVRPVFLDHRLVEFSRAMPMNMKVKNFKGKQVLREYLKTHAPWYDLNRRKQGFSIPVHTWFRTIFRDFFKSTIMQGNVYWESIYNRNYVLSLLDQHCAGQRDLGFELWGIMVSKVWMDMFLNTETKVSNND